MKFSDFLAKKPLTTDDLFGIWTQKGVASLDDPGAGELAAKVLGWMRTRVKRAIRSKELTVPKDATCKFKREKTRDNKTSETMLIYASSGDEIAKAVYCAGAFAVGGDGKAPATPIVAAPARGRGKKRDAASKTDAPAEIPYELRHSWINTTLLEKLNERECQRTVDYWNAKTK